MTSEEQQARENLAALYQLLDQIGLGHRIYTHHSTRVPHESDFILINPFGLLLHEVSASNLIKVNHAGDATNQEEVDPNKAASIIHWAIYDARDDVQCVIHHHSAASVAVSALQEGLLPMSQGAMQFYKRIGYHDYEGLAFNPDEQPRLAASLGSHRAMLLKNHGALICARSIPEAYVLAEDLEKACKSQLLAMATAAKLDLPPDVICESTSRQFESLPQPRGETRDWPAALRMLDHLGIESKT